MSSPEPQPKRHYWRWLVLAIILSFTWCGWRVWDEKQAGKEARALGWEWEVDEPIEVIRKDWKAAFRKATWLHGQRWMMVPSAEDYDEHRDLVRRLRPRQVAVFNASKWHDLSALNGLSGLRSLQLEGCKGLTNLDALKRQTELQSLWLGGCKRLANVDALTGLSELRALSLEGCPSLTNVDALKGLSSLESLTLFGCAGLTNVDALNGLSRLQSLELIGCTGLTNVDGLNGLSSLQSLCLKRSRALSRERKRALSVALPNTKIEGP